MNTQVKVGCPNCYHTWKSRLEAPVLRKAVNESGKFDVLITCPKCGKAATHAFALGIRHTSMPQPVEEEMQ